MRRFVNSVWLLALMWAGPLVFAGAWVFIGITAGLLNALLFIGLMGASSHCTRQGPSWAARFVARRIAVRQAENAAREEQVTS